MTSAILASIADETGYRAGRNWFAVDPFHAWRFMPPQLPGVYAYSWGDELIYVGQSKDLRTRLRSYRLECFRNRFGLHVRTPWGLFRANRNGGISLRIRASFRAGDWLMYERRLIRRTRPQFNRSVL